MMMTTCSFWFSSGEVKFIGLSQPDCVWTCFRLYD